MENEVIKVEKECSHKWEVVCGYPEDGGEVLECAICGEEKTMWFN